MFATNATSTVTYLTVVSKVHTLGGPRRIGLRLQFPPLFLAEERLYLLYLGTHSLRFV